MGKAVRYAAIAAMGTGLAALTLSHHSNYSTPKLPNINSHYAPIDPVTVNGKGQDNRPLNQKSLEPPTLYAPNLEDRITEDPSSAYGILVSAFSDNLDGLVHYGGEDHFKGRFADLRDIPANYLMEKLNALPKEKREELWLLYGGVINDLKASSSSNLEGLTSRGYKGGNETADLVWESIKDVWGQSKLDQTFADVIDNNHLSNAGLEAFLGVTDIYCRSVGNSRMSTDLIAKIKNYQASMPECERIQERLNKDEATDAEKEKMQLWVKTLGQIQDEFKIITSQTVEGANSEINRRIVSRLRQVNPLYGLAFEVLGL